MKNLLYKELKLSMHVTCYILPLVFGIMVAIPNYPAFVAPLYAVVCYPILFLGANKGQTTNDLFYTCNLPIRKRDVVKARLLTVTLLHLMSLVSTAIFMPVGLLFENSIVSASAAAGANTSPIAYMGLGTHSFLSFFGVTIIGYALTDLIFIPWFYKTGKSITGPTLVAILFFAVYCTVLEMIVPMVVPGLASLLDLRTGGTTGLIVGLSVFAFSLIFYALVRLLVYKISADRLEKIDF